MSGGGPARTVADAIRRDGVFRLCLDLNIWFSAILARWRGRAGTPSYALAQAVSQGASGFGRTQLVISWGMLNRLDEALRRDLRHAEIDIGAAVASIVSAAQLGTAGRDPLMVLGGTGVVPLRDEEDADVLEAAVAGRAHVLATYNFADFVGYRTEVVKRGRIAIHRTADHELIIAHPAEALPWVRTGRIDFG